MKTRNLNPKVELVGVGKTHPIYRQAIQELNAKRLQSGFTLKQMALKIGMRIHADSSPGLCKFFEGKANISMSRMDQIANVLGLQVIVALRIGRSQLEIKKRLSTKIMLRIARTLDAEILITTIPK